MDWILDNIFWLAVGAVFIWMHLKMHGGHGHGAHGHGASNQAGYGHHGHAGHAEGEGHAGCCGDGAGEAADSEASEVPEGRTNHAEH